MSKKAGYRIITYRFPSGYRADGLVGGNKEHV